MDPLTITAASGLRSRMESLDMLANNLANVATAGYKRDSESYSLYLSPSAEDLAAGADPVTAQLPVIERHWTDFSQGIIQDTGSSLDFAIDGEGMFAVDGPSGPLYTRTGRFRINGTGALVTAEGYPVRLNDGSSVRLESTAPLAVSADGTITQSGQTLGQLALVQFAQPSALSKHAGTYYSANETPQASNARLVQGKIEGSNVSAPESAVRLITVMRQFEMLTKAVQLNADMNRKAIEDVARVGS